MNESMNQLSPDAMALMFQRLREQAVKVLENTETGLKHPLFGANNGHLDIEG